MKTKFNFNQLIFKAIFLCLILSLISCKDNKEACAPQPDVSGIKLSVKIQNLNDSLRKPESPEQLAAFLSRHTVLRDFFLRKPEYPSAEIFLSAQFEKYNNPYIDTIFQDVDRIFGDLSTLEEEFTSAFRHMKYYYPDFSPPKIQAAISGFDTDLFVTDSLIIIGLDYYLGSDTKFRPGQLYDYMLRRYYPQYIVPSTILLYGISDEFNKVKPDDNTILADMIAYGKAFYFTKHMMPCTPDSILIWYSSEEIEGARFNETKIWNHFIEEQLLFSNSHLLKRKYLDERPGTYEINEKCPGRIGTWTGWQIVKSYARKNSGSTLQQIMQEDNAEVLFRKSGYKP
ncbi:MAG TPA: gliding motility lipoprotein GldB [Cyclobacteriaceae bacterium]|nr:gliding motility lipoprotein GldB [Cyclobacteriaceae bacterium]